MSREYGEKEKKEKLYSIESEQKEKCDVQNICVRFL